MPCLREKLQVHSHFLPSARETLRINPDDVWAIHAVVHCFEMLGRVDDGIRFLASDTTRWETDNLFTVHNWWHLALYQLEAGNPDQALAIYDTEINGESAAGVPIPARNWNLDSLSGAAMIAGTASVASSDPMADRHQ